MVTKKRIKELLTENGKWVLIHGTGQNRGHFKAPKIEKAAIDAFNEEVELYAKNLAIACNLVARDGSHCKKFEGGHYGQPFRSGRQEDMILAADVKCAANAMQKKLVPWLNLWALNVTAPVRYYPCKNCGNIHEYLETGKYGFICVSCGHVVRPMTMYRKEGEPDE